MGGVIAVILSIVIGMFFGVLLAAAVIIDDAENSRSSCRAENPGYECDIVFRWERAEAFR